jgi:chaperonin GroEL (HSP60 family)
MSSEFTAKNGYTINLKPNVIGGDELRALFEHVFDDMATFVAKTYGPFGENTAYHDQGKMYCTKDGWTVEQEIIYSNNTLANIVRKLIIDVSHNINIHAGDGTTTGVIVANEINKLMLKYKDSTRIHTKFLSNAIKYCVNLICDELRDKAVYITDENMEDIIYRIAEVSLDWDTEYASFISEIYKETHNPVIRVLNSGYEKSYVDYFRGYDISAKLLSEFKINEVANKKFVTEHPAILIFTYTIPGYMFEALTSVASYLRANNRELVILAPDFEKSFRDAYNALNMHLIKARQPVINMAMVRYFAEYNIEREMLLDFCFLTGANQITKDNPEGEKAITEFKENVSAAIDTLEAAKQKKVEMSVKDANSMVQSVVDKFFDTMDKYIGTCDKLSVDDKMLIADGFGGLEESEALEHRKEVIQSEIDKKTKDMTAKSMFTDEIRLKRQRLGKLKLNMGVIYVGGFGENNLKATRDALEDAINACGNAYAEGVTCGGNIAVPAAIKDIVDRIKDTNSIDGISTALVIDILEIIYTGFKNTWLIMMRNRYGEDDTINVTDTKDSSHVLAESLEDVFAVCVQTKIPWNMITGTYDETIIHPVKVETEIVKGCLSLVLTTTTTNQLLYKGYEGMDKEIEAMRQIGVEEVKE